MATETPKPLREHLLQHGRTHYVTETPNPPPAINPTDMSRADDIRSETSVPNEIYHITTLLALQVALLQDIRFSLNELLHYKQQEVHR